MDFEARARELADEFVRDVCELPDRTSPEDWPEALLITGEELHEMLLAFARSVAADAREEALRDAEARAYAETLITDIGTRIDCEHNKGVSRCLNAIRALLRAEPSPPSETVHFTKSHQRAMERKILPAPAPLESGELALERAHSILLAILSADERGQGQPFAEAMEAAAKEIGHAYF